MFARAVLLAVVLAFGAEASKLQRSRWGISGNDRAKTSLNQAFMRDLPTTTARKQNYGLSARYRRGCGPLEAGKLGGTGTVLDVEAQKVEDENPLIVDVEAATALEPEVVVSPKLTTAVISIKSDAQSPAASTAATAREPTAEEILREQVQAEYVSRGKRSQELSQLQSQLSRSVQKRKDLEDEIIREIQSLVPRIQDELQKENERVDQLTSMLTSIKEVLESKKTALSNEKNTLIQMKDVRGKVNEDVVAAGIDLAISKKQNLVQIEEGICSDISSCVVNLGAEIDDTKNKLNSMRALLGKIPRPDQLKVDEALSYTWSDVEELEGLLLASFDSARERDDKVRSFMLLFDKATASRDKVLGTLSSSRQAKAEAKQTTSPAFALATVKSDAELSSIAQAAALKASGAVAVLGLSLLDAGFKFLQAREAKEATNAVGSTITAAASVASSAGKTWNAAVEAWTEATTTTNDDVPDHVETFSNGFKAVLSNKKLKEALNELTEGAQKTSSGAGLATSVVVRRVGEELAVAGKWQDSLEDLKESVTVLGKVAFAATSRAAKAASNQKKD